MSFDSLAFALFFFITFFSYWRLEGNERKQAFLVVASFFFYGFWDYRYIALMGFVVFVAYAVARKISASTQEAIRKRWLILGLTLHLGVLGFFKYANFFLDSMNGIAPFSGARIHIDALGVLLPIGISFYTFHAISYTVDVYRGVSKAEHQISRVALYISFFPQLIAGPIVRSTFFLPQLALQRSLDASKLAHGMRLFAIGFIYKTAIADNLAAICDPVFQSPAAWSSMSLWIAALAYYGQIYFDFAGYSLMAIGCAWWFGYELPTNFMWPYSSCSVTEFWRRWHMSLSSWLRDYLYIPLGGGRQSKWMQRRNLMLTMLLGGLWHGAAWNFAIWGVMHGFALIVNKAWNDRFGAVSESGFSIWGWLLTQHWIFMAWIFFRCHSWQAATDYVAGMFGLNSGSPSPQTLPPLLILAIAIPLVLDTVYGRLAGGTGKIVLPAWSYALGIGAILGFLMLLIPLNNTPFIYFQF